LRALAGGGAAGVASPQQRPDGRQRYAAVDKVDSASALPNRPKLSDLLGLRLIFGRSVGTKS